MRQAAILARRHDPMITSCRATVLKTKTKVVIKGARLFAAVSPASARLGSDVASVLEFQTDGREIKVEFEGQPDAKELMLDFGYMQINLQLDL
ncbi:MAG: hypothetical protein AAFX77_18730 [Pseudomonadota bacterium]